MERYNASMAHILVVEDELPISRLIEMSLKGVGHTCECAADGESALRIIKHGTFDVALLDVMVPEISGFELMPFCADKGIPVIFLTAVDALEKRVFGLRMGAEDYIVKPFEIDELLARIDVVLRRNKKMLESIKVADLDIDLLAMRVTRDDQEILLTHKEYELLVFFAQNPNRALTREQIYECVWGGDMVYGSKTIDLHVQRLRRKTGLNTLRSVSKVGYRLDVPK